MQDILLVVGSSAHVVPERISEIVHHAAELGYNVIVKENMHAAAAEHLPVVLIGDAEQELLRLDKKRFVDEPDQYVIAASSGEPNRYLIAASTLVAIAAASGRGVEDELSEFREEIRAEQAKRRHERALTRANVRQTNRYHDQRLRQYGKFSNRHK